MPRKRQRQCLALFFSNSILLQVEDELLQAGRVKANKERSVVLQIFSNSQNFSFISGAALEHEDHTEKEKEALHFEQVRDPYILTNEVFQIGNIKEKWKTGEVETAEQKEAAERKELEALKVIFHLKSLFFLVSSGFYSLLWKTIEYCTPCLRKFPVYTKKY